MARRLIGHARAVHVRQRAVRARRDARGCRVRADADLASAQTPPRRPSETSEQGAAVRSLGGKGKLRRWSDCMLERGQAGGERAKCCQHEYCACLYASLRASNMSV
eukprot:3555268-Pleurochrysis_carterae.AAC.2